MRSRNKRPREERGVDAGTLEVDVPDHTSTIRPGHTDLPYRDQTLLPLVVRPTCKLSDTLEDFLWVWTLD